MHVGLDSDTVTLPLTESFACQAYLDGSGKWGVQTSQRWDAFLDWLSEAGLLTTAVPSRTPGGNKVSLDQLRSGTAGQQIPRAEVKASSLFTAEYL